MQARALEGMGARVAVAAFVVLLIAAGGTFVVNRGEDGQEITAEVGQDPLGGLSPRNLPATAWTGGQLFVFGGMEPGEGAPRILGDGALVNPETSEAEPLPPAPFEAPPYLPEAVAVGESVVVIGIPCHELATDDEGGQNCDPGGYAVAVYDLADGSWRTPELPPELSSVPTGPRRPLGATSDGRAVLEIGAEGDLWTFAPADGTWEHLASPGVRADDSCLAGDEVIVLTTTYVQADGTIDETPLEAGEVGGAENLFTEPSLRILALVGGEQGWRSSRTAGAEYSGFFPDLICLNDSAVAVDSGAARGVRVFDLATGEVSEAPPALVDGSFLNRLATATEILFFDSDFGRPGQAYNPATNTWRPFVSPPGTTDELVWTGEAVAGWSSPNLVYPTPPAEPGAFVAIPATVDLGAVGD